MLSSTCYASQRRHGCRGRRRHYRYRYLDSYCFGRNLLKTGRGSMAELLSGVAGHAPFSPLFHTYPKFGIAYEFTANRAKRSSPRFKCPWAALLYRTHSLHFCFLFRL
ncbi:hypothetical protein DSY2336 [Desulfitobacterium hafniense Y51]|uniref:Uncharacterized protein n=1 Tax=Desulfitobacterium hafniense (strain Y51) TaxID=138119 RepID=Q24V17_DESHY|nr:hypothetical protein DSY2336 [Desulfitobacterium hafniense Y51]